MATRGCIAYLSGNDIRGVYHHYDSYPSGLGAALFHFRNNVFGSTDIMLDELIDKTPNGWKSISRTTTANNVRQKAFNLQGKLVNLVCPGPINLADLASYDIEYAYIFFDSSMTIIGKAKRFDSSNQYYKEYYTGYVMLGNIDLNGEEPDWKCNENGLYVFQKEIVKVNINVEDDDLGPTGDEFDEPSIPLHLQGITL